MKLHIGCGEVIIPGWVNCDVRPLDHVDIVAPAHALGLPDGVVDEIYACHVLEHFGFGVCTPSFTDVLFEWRRVLKPGGTLRVSVPSLESIGQIAGKCTDFNSWWNLTKLIYGGSEYSENRHFVGFSMETMMAWLWRIGFCETEIFDPFVDDTSKFQMLGVPVSLNIKAKKL